MDEYFNFLTNLIEIETEDYDTSMMVTSHYTLQVAAVISGTIK